MRRFVTEAARWIWIDTAETASGALPRIWSVKENEVGDRQLDALLERLDRLHAELARLNRRLDAGEHLAPVVRELAVLNDSLQALAYAALGQQGPQVRRRRTG
jgi:hypothetical protein